MITMPIKELLTFTLGSLAVLLATHGPVNFLQSMHKVQFQILREITPTATWGSPSIFSRGTPKVRPMRKREVRIDIDSSAVEGGDHAYCYHPK